MLALLFGVAKPSLGGGWLGPTKDEAHERAKTNTTGNAKGWGHTKFVLIFFERLQLIIFLGGSRCTVGVGLL